MPKTARTSLASFESINYVLRPAKNAERRLMCTLLRRLDPLLTMSTARYVGMGSVFFADLSLFHRELAIDDMVNIEVRDDAAAKQRFAFNLPFSGIDLRHGDSTTILSQLDWDKPAVIWLDYDKKLGLEHVEALRNVVDLCKAPTFLAITVQAKPDEQGKRVEALKRRLQGESLVPIGVTDARLNFDGITVVYRDILTTAVERTIASRRSRANAGDQVVKKQLLNLRYADGVLMYTLAWVIFSNDQSATVDQIDTSDLWFVSDSDREDELLVPPLTLREILSLNQQLPTHGTPATPGLRDDFVKAYQKLYRHYPSFFEVEV
jgi:hypothetical protein